MSSGVEAVENEVVVRNNLRGGERRSIASEMRIGDQRYIEACRNGTAASGIDTVFGHGTRDDEMGDFAGYEFFCESGLVEGVRCFLSDNGLISAGKDGGMDRPIRALRFERMTLGTVVLNEEDGDSRGTRLAEQDRYR